MTQETNAATAELAAIISSQVAEHLNRRQKITSPWMTPVGAAEYLHLTIRGLEDLRANGTGPKFHKVNTRIVRYHIADLDQWLLSNGGGHEG